MSLKPKTKATRKGSIRKDLSRPSWKQTFKWISEEDRIHTRDKAWWRWMKLRRPKSGQITIYRGVSKEKGTWANSIKPGDWVTLNKKQAEYLYAHQTNAKVLELTVPLSHIAEASTNSPTAGEFFYLPID